MTQMLSLIDAQLNLPRLKRAACARAILNKPMSSVPTLLASMFGGGTCTYLLSSSEFKASLPLSVLVGVGAVGAIVNAMDCWTTRRRLEAAIDLLKLQDEWAAQS
ncbi:MAG: hypothetical protein QFF03_20715 [Pseudomonadota bacterium]|nr:hypothetical protein [Pseudomonadota bacterium]